MGTDKLKLRSSQIPAEIPTICCYGAPRCKGTLPQIPIMASRYQVQAKIEQIIHSGMNTQESLRLPHRLEAAHTSFSHTSRQMRKLCPVISILGCIVKGFRDELSMHKAIASQLICRVLGTQYLIVITFACSKNSPGGITWIPIS